VPQANHPDKKGVAQANQTVKEQILKGYDAETRKINFYFSFSVSFSFKTPYPNSDYILKK